MIDDALPGSSKCSSKHCYHRRQYRRYNGLRCNVAILETGFSVQTGPKNTLIVLELNAFQCLFT